MYPLAVADGDRRFCPVCRSAGRQISFAIFEGDFRRPYQVKDGNLHHTLIEVCCPVLDNLHRYNFLCLEILTFDDLAKGALAEHIEDQIAVPTVN